MDVCVWMYAYYYYYFFFHTNGMYTISNLYFLSFLVAIELHVYEEIHKKFKL